MKRIYVNKKSDITKIQHVAQSLGAACYRTRIECECGAANGNSRQCMLVVKNDAVMFGVIRCKGCTATHVDNITDCKTKK